MSRLIDAEAITDHEIIDYLGIRYVSCLDDVRDMLNDQPTIEAAPVRRGEWEVVTGVMTPGGDPLLRCPFCKSKESHHMGGIEFPQDWDYCPKCGADMRKGCVE